MIIILRVGIIIFMLFLHPSLSSWICVDQDSDAWERRKFFVNEMNEKTCASNSYRNKPLSTIIPVVFPFSNGAKRGSNAYFIEAIKAAVSMGNTVHVISDFNNSFFNISPSYGVNFHSKLILVN